MAAVKTMTGKKLLVQIGDGGSPTETFAHDCLINGDRSAAFSSDAQEFVIPDCDTPDLPGWKEVEIDGLSLQVSGSGMLHTASTEAWFNWFSGGAAKNCRIKVDVAGALGGGYWAGAFKLQSFNLSGSQNGKTTVDVTLVSHGAITWDDNA